MHWFFFCPLDHDSGQERGEVAVNLGQCLSITWQDDGKAIVMEAGTGDDRAAWRLGKSDTKRLFDALREYQVTSHGRPA